MPEAEAPKPNASDLAGQMGELRQGGMSRLDAWRTLRDKQDIPRGRPEHPGVQPTHRPATKTEAPDSQPTSSSEPSEKISLSEYYESDEVDPQTGKRVWKYISQHPSQQTSPSEQPSETHYIQQPQPTSGLEARQAQREHEINAGRANEAFVSEVANRLPEGTLDQFARAATAAPEGTQDQTVDQQPEVAEDSGTQLEDVSSLEARVLRSLVGTNPAALDQVLRTVQNNFVIHSQNLQDVINGLQDRLTQSSGEERSQIESQLQDVTHQKEVNDEVGRLMQDVRENDLDQLDVHDRLSKRLEAVTRGAAKEAAVATTPESNLPPPIGTRVTHKKFGGEGEILGYDDQGNARVRDFKTGLTATDINPGDLSTFEAPAPAPTQPEPVSTSEPPLPAAVVEAQIQPASTPTVVEGPQPQFTDEQRALARQRIQAIMDEAKNNGEAIDVAEAVRRLRVAADQLTADQQAEPEVSAEDLAGAGRILQEIVTQVKRDEGRDISYEEAAQILHQRANDSGQ